MKEDKPKIELLFYPGCASMDSTLGMVKEVLGGGELDGTISKIIVDTEQKAVQLKFIGSPSVRVNGRDIEPGADTRKDYGLH